MTSPANRPSHGTDPSYDDDVPMTVPVPRFDGMQWPGEGDVAHIPVTLILAARGRCSCQECCEGFVALLRRSRLRAA
jgi:hypothetical protein